MGPDRPDLRGRDVGIKGQDEGRREGLEAPGAGPLADWDEAARRADALSRSLGHRTVMLREAVGALRVAPDGTYVDCTYGRGGHSALILSRLGPKGRLVAFDRDAEAIAAAKEAAARDARLIPVRAPFDRLAASLAELEVGPVDGVLMDLGVSSPQIDDARRGFSFLRDAPLDMRMDVSSGPTAAQWLAEASEREIARVLRDYSDERFARAVAREICAERAIAPVDTTLRLASICERAVKTREKGQHPATRTFQALRIAVNDELGEAQRALPQAARALAPGGRLVVISFHSLEDRIVKRFFASRSQAPKPPKWVALRDSELPRPVLAADKGFARPSEAEREANPRSRSAVMRCATRTSAPWTEQGEF